MAKKNDSIQGVMKPMSIEKMVAAPIIAAVKAQSLMNEEMIEFLDNIALDKDGEVRMIPFTFESDQLDEKGVPTGKTKKVSVNVPYMTLVDAPSLAIETVDVSFDLRIHTSSNYKEIQHIKDSRGRKVEVEKDKIDIETSLSNSTSGERKSDTSARYKFKLTAKKQERSEALTRIMDILTESSIIPKLKTK